MTDGRELIDDEGNDKLLKDERPASLRRTIIITIVVLALIIGALYFWRMMRSGGQAWQAQEVPVTAMVAKTSDVPVSLDAVGSLSAVREVLLAPEVAGRVSSIHFNSGDYVRSGAPLVNLYAGPEIADRKAAQARAEFARLQLKRSEELAPTGAESQELLQERRSQLQEAEAAVAQLDARIRQKRILAPFSGKLGIRQIDPGEYLNAGAPVASLTALNQLYVDFSLPQQDLAKLEPGTEVNVVTDAFPGQTFTAKINALDPKIDEGTRNVRVQATLPNPGQNLRPGMYVTASVMLAPEKGVIVLPLTAIQTSAQGDSVVVIRGETARKKGKAEFVPVKTGRRVGESVVIKSGIKPGDVIVTQGQLRVQPGADLAVSNLVSTNGTASSAKPKKSAEAAPSEGQ
ncbi:efflux RND transporter periplasmic adaptor subunit [Altericroceibacterium spongiae]|uniref:Efflux RND transporter periplasmic adaptor subunit n=1 Tax=Altericroceibacterium spongiae TaxID=2320269 RepID=A0A420EJH6_9SPHN|nr:efflux RND transporter periplasmic adaptor subunit [Altericroceibacterium spongiae]RKF20813.1 efflux RND transporter periplasmic adaptor subunit [Altericroceibacterium spongiae]